MLERFLTPAARLAIGRAACDPICNQRSQHACCTPCAVHPGHCQLLSQSTPTTVMAHVLAPPPPHCTDGGHEQQLTSICSQPHPLPQCHTPSCRMPADWVVVLNTDVATSDIPCSSTNKPAALAKEGGSSSSSSSSKAGSCRVCGGAAEVSAACVAHPACVAFVMSSQNPGCGTLKGSTSGQGGSSTHTLYCNRARGAKCTGRGHWWAAGGVGGGGWGGGWDRCAITGKVGEGRWCAQVWGRGAKCTGGGHRQPACPEGCLIVPAWSLPL
jgi:hypothetical protein